MKEKYLTNTLAVLFMIPVFVLIWELSAGGISTFSEIITILIFMMFLSFLPIAGLYSKEKWYFTYVNVGSALFAISLILGWPFLVIASGFLYLGIYILYLGSIFTLTLILEKDLKRKGLLHKKSQI